ncbi:SsrA-binding protein [subsurface metagenome]
MENKIIIATNRKAYRDYIIEEKYETGISLKGSEVKSVRNRNVNFKDSYATVKKGEVILHNLHISPYEKIGYEKIIPDRDRKLLLKRREINRIMGRTTERGYTIVPLKIYLKGKYVKVELGLAKGKKKYDKRRDIIKRDQEREQERALKEYEKGV